MEISSALQETTVPLLTGLLGKAVNQNVFVDFTSIFEVREALEHSEMQGAIRQFHDIQGDIPYPRVTDIEPQELSKMLYGIKEQRMEKIIGNWRFKLISPKFKGEGTLTETSIQKTRRGNLEMKIVPNQVATRSASDDLRWGVSTILSGRDFLSEFLYDLFTEETVLWTPIDKNMKENGEKSTFILGECYGVVCPIGHSYIHFLTKMF